jgi:hypothetical protein
VAIDYSGFKHPKGDRHQRKAQLRADREKLDAHEAEQKSKARVRDGHKCCWPHQTEEDRLMCRAARLHVAHYKGKGMGGDHGVRTKRRNLITFCEPTHIGPKWSLHGGFRRVVPLDPTKVMDGPRAFEEKRGGRWVEVGREIHVGVLA